MKNTHMPSIEVIERWLKDEDCDVRAAAMNACQGREVPLEVIEQGLKDESWRVRAAAMNACKANNIPIPVIRTIEPPKLVYKKCVGGIIVVASIPYDLRTLYYAGDEVEIDNFDLSNEECSTGFHFFCTIEEARSY